MVIMTDSIASYSSESDEIIDEGETNFDGNAGWANSISKILKSGKPKKKKTLVLSRAKKIGDKKAETKLVNFEIQGDDGEIRQEKLEPAPEAEEKKQTAVVKKRKQLPQLRVKPNILERDRERMLSKIATKGVVQLFNAVKMQQKNIETQLKEAGPLEVRRDKVLKSIDKDSFFDLLDKDVESKKASEKGAPATTKEGTWNVLKDDFMLKAKYRDWDKQTQDEDQEEEMEIEEEIESD